MADMASYAKRVGAKYLEDTRAKEGIKVMKSGMLIEVVNESTKDGAKSPEANSQCKVTYSGTLHDGTPFDAGTTSFAPNQVIKGWTEAMQYMVEGDKWKLHIPYDLAYGERGAGPTIKPFSTLVFDIEIHEVKNGGKSKEDARAMLGAGTASSSTGEADGL